MSFLPTLGTSDLYLLAFEQGRFYASYKVFHNRALYYPIICLPLRMSNGVRMRHSLGEETVKL